MEANLTPHEFLKKLRNGEEPKCPECGKGVIKPIGDCRTTHGFVCTQCKLTINID